MAQRLEPFAAWQVLLLALQALQVAFLWLHDWIPLGRLNDVAAARYETLFGGTHAFLPRRHGMSQLNDALARWLVALRRAAEKSD